MCIIGMNTSRNRVEITHCNFIMNSATWGGGLYMEIQENSEINAIVIENSVFLQE